MAKVRTNLKTKRPTFIRAWRKHRGLTLERMAERIDVTPGALSQLERGAVGYTQPMLEALADALSCEPADLLIRDPLQANAFWSIWDRIPEAQRKQAIAVLETFAKTGTDG